MAVLTRGTYVNHYQIHETILQHDQTVLYLAHDFQYDQAVLLLEYYPEKLVNRNFDDSEGYTVLPDGIDANTFETQKQAFINISRKYQKIQNKHILPVLGSFHANGTVYRVFKVPEAKPLKHLIESAQVKLDEKRITIIVKQIVEGMLALENQHLTLSNRYEDIFFDENNNVILNGSMNISVLSPSSRRETILNLGVLLFEMAADQPFQSGDKLKSGAGLSSKFCTLVNSMLSHADTMTLTKIYVELTGKQPDKKIAVKKPEQHRFMPSRTRILVWSCLLLLGTIVFQSNNAKRKLSYYIYDNPMFYNLVAAASGDKSSQDFLEKQELGFSKGYVTDQDVSKAFEWYLDRANKGDAYGQFVVGYMYSHGLGVEKNSQKAIEWLEKSRMNGFKKGNYQLAYMYMYADPSLRDYKKAFSLCQDLAEQKDRDGEMALGYMYEMGYGVQKDYKTALELYKRSAKQGHIVAQFNLANAYHKGRGTPVNLQKAKYWYSMAAEQGYISAEQRLQNLNH